MIPQWTTACPDWAERIVAGKSLIPFDPLYPTEAEAALAVFRSLKIVDAAGSPTFGAAARPWILDFVSAIFGAYDAATGRRLIQYFLLLISKKNGKSTLAAGIMVTALIRNWRESGEYYILAPTKEVADNSYLPACDMVMADPDLRTILKPCAGRVIEHRNTGAFLKVVAADNETISGKKTIGLLVDELWLFGKRASAPNLLLEATGGLASRPEGFVIYLSAQSEEKPAGVFAQQLEEFRSVRDGTVIDQSKLPVLYEFPDDILRDEAYLRPEHWYVTNPNLGVSVDGRYIAAKLAEAERAGRANVIGLCAKHLNVQVGTAIRIDGWAGAQVWDRGAEPGLTLDALLDRSEAVTVGIDGGGLDDLLGVAVIGREKGTKRWLAWAHALISDIGIERRRANIVEYDRFEADGDLTKFVYLGNDEMAPNIQYIVDLVRQIRNRGLLAGVGVDAAGIGAIVDALEDIGVSVEDREIEAIPQGIKLMGAIKTVEIKLAGYSFRHGASEMLRWCVGNLRVIPTPTAMRVARDEAGYGKIDPVIAMFNAAALMSANPHGARSVYEDHGLLVL